MRGAGPLRVGGGRHLERSAPDPSVRAGPRAVGAGQGRALPPVAAGSFVTKIDFASSSKSLWFQPSYSSLRPGRLRRVWCGGDPAAASRVRTDGRLSHRLSGARGVERCFRAPFCRERPSLSGATRLCSEL